MTLNATTPTRFHTDADNPIFLQDHHFIWPLPASDKQAELSCIKHLCTFHRRPAKTIERVEDFFQMSDDWFIVHLSFIVPSPPIGCWIQSYVWPWRWHSHTALFQRSSELHYFRSAPFFKTPWPVLTGVSYWFRNREPSDVKNSNHGNSKSNC
jgi:hypothetical protein